jgi:hypothetical protein
MEGGNIFLQPAKDLVAQPMRHLVAKVGQHVSVAAKQDINMSSTEGGLALKAQKSIYSYAAEGGVILHSDSELYGGEFIPTPGDTQQPIQEACGVILHAPGAGVYSHGKEVLSRATEKHLVYGEMVVHQAERELQLLSKNLLSLYSVKDAIVACEGNFLCGTAGVALILGDQATIVGKEEQVIGVSPLGPVQGLMKQEQVDDFLEQLEQLKELEVAKVATDFREDTRWDDLLFLFPKSESYGISAATDPFPQTMAQQEDELTKEMGFQPWKETEVNGSYPYPGADMSDILVTAELKNLEPSGTDLYNKTTDNESSSQLNTGRNIFTEYKTK